MKVIEKKVESILYGEIENGECFRIVNQPTIYMNVKFQTETDCKWFACNIVTGKLTTFPNDTKCVIVDGEFVEK